MKIANESGNHEKILTCFQGFAENVPVPTQVLYIALLLGGFVDISDSE